MGHSLGGSTVMECAADDAGFATQLVLVDPGLSIPFNSETLVWICSAFDVTDTEESVAAAHPGWHRQDAYFKAIAMTQSSRLVAEQTFLQNDS